MKIYIMTDLEGPAMLNRFTQTRDVTPEEKKTWERYLTGEVNACIDGILDFDAQAEVIVLDGHGSGGIDEWSFHPKGKLIARGRGMKSPFWLDETFDAVMFVGQHAMMSSGGVLCHTYSSKTIEYHRINDVELGEFGSFALLAGSIGVPTVFIAGDDLAIDEAKALIPDIVGAEVKKSLARELALHLSHPAACELIRAKAAEACARIPEIKPYYFPGPYTLEIRVLEGISIQGFLDRGAELVDNCTIRIHADTVQDLKK